MNISYERKIEMINHIKSKAAKTERFVVQLSHSIASILVLCILLVIAIYVPNGNDAANQTMKSSEIPYERASYILPDDIIMPKAPFELVKEPTIQYTFSDNQVNNVHIRFEGEEKIAFIQILKHSLEEVIANTTFKKEYVQLIDGTKAVFLHVGLGKLYFQQGDYVYSLSLARIEDMTPSQTVIVQEQNIHALMKMANEIKKEGMEK